jgi:predicted membrane protein
VDSGTDKLAAADFTYNLASWKPEMRYTSAAGRGSLTIRQSESHQPHLGKNEYEWDLRLNREVPLDLTVHFGAGEAHLNVGGLTLRSVDVEMGVGRLALDLDGRPKQSYNVNVSGGVGEATIHLPAGVGVDAEATGGIGSIQASGLRKRGDRYFNDAYADSKVTIHLTVHGGVGSIRLIAD